MHLGKLASVLLLTPLLLLGFGGPSAEAANCADDIVCNVHLTNTNTPQLAPIDVLVQIDNTGATTVLRVSLVSDPISNAFQGFVSFGYNNAATAVISNDDATKWTANKAGSNQDGFGAFVSSYGRSGNPLGVQACNPQSPACPTPLTFTLSSLVTSFSENGNGAEFATHLQYAGNCSGWASDGTDGSSPNTNCTGTGVAEPGVLFMVGSGLVGLGYLRRRWSKKA